MPAEASFLLHRVKHGIKPQEMVELVSKDIAVLSVDYYPRDATDRYDWIHFQFYNRKDAKDAYADALRTCKDYSPTWAIRDASSFLLYSQSRPPAHDPKHPRHCTFYPYCTNIYCPFYHPKRQENLALTQQQQSEPTHSRKRGRSPEAVRAVKWLDENVKTTAKSVKSLEVTVTPKQDMSSWNVVQVVEWIKTLQIPDACVKKGLTHATVCKCIEDNFVSGGMLLKMDAAMLAEIGLTSRLFCVYLQDKIKTCK